MQLADRLSQIKPSPTIQISDKAKAFRAEGRSIISLSAGEPDFDTPVHIKDAGIEAINAGDTKYTAVDGTPALKSAIISKLERDNQLTYASPQILVSCGAKHSLYNLFSAWLNPGDEVIIPAPYWVSYPDMAKLCGAKPVFVTAGIKQQFKITPQMLAQAITPNAKMFVINSPSNPTGMVYTKAELATLADVLKDHPQILVVTDDIYEPMNWSDEPFANILNACPELYERTVVINGVSKAYAMTGWRIGYAAGPKELIGGMKKLQSQSTTNACSIAQAAAVAALEGDQSCVASMCDAFKSRHDWLVAALNDLPGHHCLAGMGTFYAFADIRGAIEQLDGVDSDVEYCALMLEKASVAMVPGSAFGLPGFVRLSFATDLDSLKQAIDNIRAVLPVSVQS